jgi:hypothetical protein
MMWNRSGRPNTRNRKFPNCPSHDIHAFHWQKRGHMSRIYHIQKTPRIAIQVQNIFPKRNTLQLTNYAHWIISIYIYIPCIQHILSDTWLQLFLSSTAQSSESNLKIIWPLRWEKQIIFMLSWAILICTGSWLDGQMSVHFTISLQYCLLNHLTVIRNHVYALCAIWHLLSCMVPVSGVLWQFETLISCARCLQDFWECSSLVLISYSFSSVGTQHFDLILFLPNNYPVCFIFGRLRGRSSSPSRVKKFHFSISSRPALGPIQPPIQ